MGYKGLVVAMIAGVFFAFGEIYSLFYLTITGFALLAGLAGAGVDNK